MLYSFVRGPRSCSESIPVHTVAPISICRPRRAQQDESERLRVSYEDLVNEHENSLQTERAPRNLAHDLLRELPSAECFRREANTVDWQIDHFMASELLQNVPQVEILETVRTVCSSSGTTSSGKSVEAAEAHHVLVPHDFDLHNQILIALLDSGLLVPRYDPTRLEPANEFTRRTLLNWAEYEYDRLSVADKLSYNVALWKHREAIQRRTRGVVRQ